MSGMPVWVIELFAGENLDSAYLFVALMTAPIWLAMLIRPQSTIVRFLAQPVVVCGRLLPDLWLDPVACLCGCGLAGPVCEWFCDAHAAHATASHSLVNRFFSVSSFVLAHGDCTI